MDQTRESQLRDAALGVVAILVSATAFLLPSLAAGLDGSTSLTGALLAVALAALLATAHATTASTLRTSSVRIATRRPVPLVLATRATDPTHHPLRPRAPGTR